MSRVILSTADLKALGLRAEGPVAAELAGDQMKVVVGHRLRLVLEKRGMSMAELARRLEVEPPTVTRWCDGTNALHLFTVMTLASELDVSYAELLPDADRPSRQAA